MLNLTNAGWDMKKLNNKGFGAVQIFLLLIIIGLIAGVGYFVYNSQKKTNQSLVNVTSSQAKPQKIEKNKTDDSFTAPEGWITITKNGITVSYPNEWDNTDEDYQKLRVIGKVDGNTAGVGFGTPYGYKFENKKWMYVDSDGNPAEEINEIEISKINVKGAESTIVVGGGDGGCGGSRIIFVKDGVLFAVALPWDCEAANNGPSGVASEAVDKYLDKVIESIVIN